MALQNVLELKHLQGKRVLVRTDFNVSAENGIITDSFRIKSSLETIRFLIKQGAKVILLSSKEGKDGETLRPVFDYLQKFLPISFAETLDDDRSVSLSNELKSGEVLLYENIRNYKEEKENDPDFAKRLARLGEYYVNEAFSVSHREHASIVGIPCYLPSYVGIQFTREVEQLSKAFSPQHPFLFIIGGAKFDTKEPLIRKFLKNADHVFVGGALANDFYKELGFFVGDSLVSNTAIDIRDLLTSNKLVLPPDVIIRNPQGEKEIVANKKVPVGGKIYDAGPESLTLLQDLISKAKFIIWNGPLGNYEEGFNEGTEKLASMIAESKAVSIVGGGDTITAISGQQFEDRFSFLSTGGGAMLQYLSFETLSGIEAIIKSQKKFLGPLSFFRYFI